MDTMLLRAISSPRRLAILRLVWDGERSAGEIASEFDVSWSAISQNIRILCAAGALSERRVGTKRLYRADHGALGPLADVVRSMWVRDLETLTDLAEARERGA